MKKYLLKRGVLIAIEGIDGAGKTTQVRRLKDHFTRIGLSVSTFKEPTDGKYGQLIRKLAKEGREDVTPEYEMELFLKDRQEDCNLYIKPSLEKNKLVLMDRYYFSSIAYQGSRGLDTDLIWRENEKVAIIPDLVIILDCAVTIGLNRIKYFRNEIPNHFEKEEHLEKARVIFKKMNKPYIQLVDSSRDEEAVFNHIKNIVTEIISPETIIITDQPSLFESENKNIPSYFKN